MTDSPTETDRSAGAISTEDRKQIIEVARSLSKSGLVTGTSGNVSLRRGDAILITPSAVDYDVLEKDMLAIVSISGNVLEHTVAASSETPLHLAIYRSTSATAVVHTHSPYATAVGLVVDELPAVHYAIRALGGPVRVARYATFGTVELANNVSDAMVDRRGALMRNHGAVTIGDSLNEARTNAEKLEWLATLYFRAAQLGNPSVLTAEQLADVARAAQKSGYHL